jgi:hypothetical protein
LTSTWSSLVNYSSFVTNTRFVINLSETIIQDIYWWNNFFYKLPLLLMTTTQTSIIIENEMKKKKTANNLLSQWKIYAYWLMFVLLFFVLFFPFTPISFHHHPKEILIETVQLLVLSLEDRFHHWMALLKCHWFTHFWLLCESCTHFIYGFRTFSLFFLRHFFCVH